MTAQEELEDFQRELAEKESIRKMPWNNLSSMALLNVKKSNISKKIDERYSKITLIEFLNATGKKQ